MILEDDLLSTCLAGRAMRDAIFGNYTF